MRKSYIRGSKGSIILAIILFLVSFMFTAAAINSFRNLETLYKEGDNFSGDSGYSIIKVAGIEEQNIVDEKLKEDEKFYLVDYEHGFIMLKATEKELEKFLDGRKLQDGKLTNLSSENIYKRIDAIPEVTRGRRSRKVNISYELRRKLIESAQKSSLIRERVKQIIAEVGIKDNKDAYKSKLQEKPFYSNMYLETTGWGYYGMFIGIPSVLSAITIGVIFSIRRRIRHARSEYEELFIEFPETERDLDILLREAQYIDEGLKVLIYKDSLIVYKGVFNFEPLRDIKQLEFRKVTDSKGRLQGYMLDILRLDDTSNFDIKIGMIRKETEQRIVQLGNYIKEEYKKRVGYRF